MNIKNYEIFIKKLKEDPTYKNFSRKQFFSACVYLFSSLFFIAMFYLTNYFLLLIIASISIAFTYWHIDYFNNKIDAYLSNTYPAEYENMKKVKRYYKLVEKENNGEFQNIEEYEELKGLLA